MALNKRTKNLDFIVNPKCGHRWCRKTDVSSFFLRPAVFARLFLEYSAAEKLIEPSNVIVDSIWPHSQRGRFSRNERESPDETYHRKTPGSIFSYITAFPVYLFGAIIHRHKQNVVEIVQLENVVYAFYVEKREEHIIIRIPIALRSNR